MILKDLSYIIAILIEIVLPIVLAIYIARRYKVSWAIFFLGAGLFLASLIRIPLNNYLIGLLKYDFFGSAYILVTTSILSFSASIFEEGVRVLAFGLLIKNRSFHKGVMYGIGHGGGGESMVLVGLSTLANYIVFRFFPGLLPGIAASQFQAVQWYMPLIGAAERIMTIAIQIALSVLVMNAFLKRKYYYILLAVIYHFLVDFAVTNLSQRFNILYAELSVLFFAAIGIAIIFLLRPKKDVQSV